jgi:hypothetical protein
VRDRDRKWERLSEWDLVLDRVCCTAGARHSSRSSSGSAGRLVSTAFDLAVSYRETRADLTDASQQVSPIRTPPAASAILSFVLHPLFVLVPHETSEMRRQ